VHPNQVWALDFQFDETADGRRLKLLNVVDEYTRQALVMHVGRRADADTVVDVLDRLVGQRGRRSTYGWTTGLNSSPGRYGTGAG